MEVDVVDCEGDVVLQINLSSSVLTVSSANTHKDQDDTRSTQNLAGRSRQ